MKLLCAEFARQYRITIDFQNGNVPDNLSSEIAHAFLRVLQESLNNVAKHSGAARVDVRLRASNGHINLMVTDSGKGFDVKRAYVGGGLGLESMRERMRLLDGVLVLRSKPKRGTTIHASVPLDRQPDATLQSSKI